MVIKKYRVEHSNCMKVLEKFQDRNAVIEEMSFKM